MDVQLSETKMKDSFLRSSAVAGERGADGQHVRDELDDDVNLIASAMESVSSQLGGSGPVTNVLGGLSVAVPPEWRTKQ